MAKRKRGRAITPPTQEEWEALGMACEWSSTKMAEALDIHPSTLYAWLDRYPAFKQAYERKATIGIQLLAADHYERVVKSALAMALGVQEVDERGHFAGWKVEPDRNLLIYLIDKFSDVLGIGTKPSNDVNININTGQSVPIATWLDAHSVQDAQAEEVVSDDTSTPGIPPTLPE